VPKLSEEGFNGGACGGGDACASSDYRAEWRRDCQVMVPLDAPEVCGAKLYAEVLLEMQG